LEIKMTSGATKLTQKEEAFCLSIVEGQTQSNAYRKAYNAGRMKAKTVNEKASRLMAKGKIRARVSELMKPVIADAQMKRREWLERLTRLARFDPRKMFDDQGRPKPIAELAEGEAEAIEVFERIEQYDGTGVLCRAGYRVHFISRLDALALIGKALGYDANQYGDRKFQNETAVPPVTLNFVQAPMPPDEAYRRMTGG
jgi:phage terminase small subunit